MRKGSKFDGALSCHRVFTRLDATPGGMRLYFMQHSVVNSSIEPCHPSLWFIALDIVDLVN